MELNNEKFTMMLEHMLGHNKHHTEDLMDMVENAKYLEKTDVSELILEAKSMQDQANKLLEKALDLVK